MNDSRWFSRILSLNRGVAARWLPRIAGKAPVLAVLRPQFFKLGKIVGALELGGNFLLVLMDKINLSEDPAW